MRCGDGRIPHRDATVIPDHANVDISVTDAVVDAPPVADESDTVDRIGARADATLARSTTDRLDVRGIVIVARGLTDPGRTRRIVTANEPAGGVGTHNAQRPADIGGAVAPAGRRAARGGPGRGQFAGMRIR